MNEHYRIALAPYYELGLMRGTRSHWCDMDDVDDARAALDAMVGKEFIHDWHVLRLFFTHSNTDWEEDQCITDPLMYYLQLVLDLTGDEYQDYIRSRLAGKWYAGKPEPDPDGCWNKVHNWTGVPWRAWPHSEH